MSSAMNSNLVNAGSGDCPRDAERAKTPDEGYKQAFVDGLVNGSNRLQARIPVRSGAEGLRQVQTVALTEIT